jgi:serine/threonine protein kinase
MVATPSKWSAECNDFIAKCLIKDPSQRPTAVQLQDHPFIKGPKEHSGLVDLIQEFMKIQSEKPKKVQILLPKFLLQIS